jgi:hypothetical protein
MDTIIQFTLPGLAAALVFFMIIMSCPMRDTLLQYHWLVDFVFTGIMMMFLAGTFSGAMTAAMGGIMLTIMLWIANFFLVPIGDPCENDY